jgi:outer membrane lipoprotein-sorting protein
MIATVIRAALLYSALLLPATVQAFDLMQLQSQLTAAAVVRGDFVQEKHLRALPQPLVSDGDFVLASGKGMLWRLRRPLTQTLRITTAGISRQNPDGTWRPSANANGQESRLFLALLAGDATGLSENFDLDLAGGPEDWRLTLTPSSALLRQIFTSIEVRGGKTITRIELREAQGDRSVLRLLNTRTDTGLDDDEQRAYRH